MFEDIICRFRKCYFQGTNLNRKEQKEDDIDSADQLGCQIIPYCIGLGGKRTQLFLKDVFGYSCKKVYDNRYCGS